MLEGGSPHFSRRRRERRSRDADRALWGRPRRVWCDLGGHARLYAVGRTSPGYGAVAGLVRKGRAGSLGSGSRRHIGACNNMAGVRGQSAIGGAAPVGDPGAAQPLTHMAAGVRHEWLPPRCPPEAPACRGGIGKRWAPLPLNCPEPTFIRPLPNRGSRPNAAIRLC